MAEAFEATGTALFLNVIVDGKEKHIDLTDFAFMKCLEKKSFCSRIENQIRSRIKKYLNWNIYKAFLKITTYLFYRHWYLY